MDLRRVLAASILSVFVAWPVAASSFSAFSGRVIDRQGAAVAGAMVTLRHGDPLHATTVYTGDDGRWQMSVPEAESYDLRVRRIGWQDLRLADWRPGPRAPDLTLERETDPAKVAAQLPANRWVKLALDRIETEEDRETFVRQCTYCHQQGSWATRRVREPGEWDKVLALMARMGGMLPSHLREQMPGILNAAYDPATAVPALTADMDAPDFAPPPSAEARRAVIDEWELGLRASMQHDLAVHPDGRIYSVDMTQDQLYRLDPSLPGGDRRAWDVPDDGMPLGGVFGAAGPTPPNANAHVGPHSLQMAPDGSVWITLALGNRLARFDPKTEEWKLVELQHGYYPHTLRFDQKGRIWYTIAVSNHVGMYDPGTGEHREVRLPAGSFGQAVTLRMMPAFLWLNRRFDLSSAGTAGEGVELPIPYGVDVAPDGSVWFSQLNEHRIGRIDPDTWEVEMIDTPFSAPRRLRFDSQGKLWIPGFSSSLISRFDPETREFQSWLLPIEPLGTATPYALNVDRRTDTVWICGTNSDTMIRFEPARERFTVYPMPTRVTYTREVDFDDQGRIWTSNSNAPTWQIEGGFPRVLRIDPGGGDPELASRAEGVR